MSSEDKLIRILSNLESFSKNFLIIHDKDGVRQNFAFNRAQRYVDLRLDTQLKETGLVRALILKGRQQGISTYVSARYFRKTITQRGKKTFILTHSSDATRAIFGMTKRYAENLDPTIFPQPDKKNDNALAYDLLESGYRVGTAGNENIGRSMTNQFLHLSEYAFYKNASNINLGLTQTVAELPRTEIIKESTANGVDNDFYFEWRDSKNGNSRYQAIFVPWYWQDEYCLDDTGFHLSQEEREWIEIYGGDGLRAGHLKWRRIKMQDIKGDEEQKFRKFRQEYPFTDEEAFLSSITDSFIQADLVRRARNNRVDSSSKLVIGVDPARKGGDRTAIIRRKGRKAYGLETFYGIDTMDLVAVIRRIIDTEKPARVCIDCIGIGAGVVDRLHELGYDNIVIGVNVAKTAEEPEKYKNTRAELHDRLRDWLCQDLDVEIPDSDELQTDLTALGYKYDAADRLQIESKDDAKKRGILSPDTSEALVLTFYGGEYVVEGRTPYHTISERARHSLI